MNFDVKVTDSIGAECTQPVTIDVTTQCPDWDALSWTAPILDPGIGGGSASASAVGNSAQIQVISGTAGAASVVGMTGTVNWTGTDFDAYITVNVTNYVDFLDPNSNIKFLFEVRQNAALLASFRSTQAFSPTNSVTIIDADGTRVLAGQMPGTFVVHIHGIAAVGSVLKIWCTTGGGTAAWAYVSPDSSSNQPQLSYNLSVSCTPPP